MPNLLNNSGCFKGSSTISLIFILASSKSPISSKVIAGTCNASSFTASSLITISVLSVTIPAGPGVTDITTKEKTPPIPIEIFIMSPFVTGLGL
jgi:hypothetical protein